MKLTDYLAQILKTQGIQTVYGVTGGAAVHLFDSAQKYGIRCLFTHHEQAAAFAACAHARIKGLGAAFFTTGPGGSNALTGVAAAWLDSIPTIYIGGQVRSNHVKPATIRQQGTQELDVISLMQPITKYAKRIERPSDIEHELRTCIRCAISGRPGPVYLEIPLEFQWAEVQPVHPFTKITKDSSNLSNTLKDALVTCFSSIRQAKSPLFLIGQGVKLSGASKEICELLDVWQAPFISTWNAADGLATSSPLYLGSAGMYGTRQANMAIQRTDLLCCIGTHLPIPITTGNFESFAPQAKIIVVNIDEKELEHQRIKTHQTLQMDAKEFIQLAKHALTGSLGSSTWRQNCKELRSSYFREKARRHNKDCTLDTYSALDVIFQFSSEGDIFVVDGGGTTVQATFQSVELKSNQKLLIDAGLCCMGSGLPQAIGAATSNMGHLVFCLCGDGSLQFNVQELQTIFHHQLPIALCIFNNQGYLSIRHTQKEFLEENYLGSDEEGGISVPSIEAVAQAYKIPSMQIETLHELKLVLGKIRTSTQPVILEIKVPVNSEVVPRLGFHKNQNGQFSALPIDQMFPEEVASRETSAITVNM